MINDPMPTDAATLQAIVATLYKALHAYTPMSRYQFFYRDRRGGTTPGHGPEPPAYDKAVYKNRILEDDGDTARAGVHAAGALMGAAWCCDLIEEVEGPGYWDVSEETDDDDGD